MNLKTVGALLAAWTVAAGCASEMKQQKGYIGPSEIRIDPGDFSPFASEAFRRLR